jgi:hypothetical protein
MSVPAELHGALRSGEGNLWNAVSISRQNLANFTSSWGNIPGVLNVRVQGNLL